MNEARTIRVTGSGMIRLKPDTMRITLTIEGVCPEYGMTLVYSASDSARFREALMTVGFAREDLKTLNFNVRPEYEDYQEEGVYKRRLVGFRSRHELSVAFPSDNERLGHILAAIAGTGLSPEISIGYTVQDRETAKNALLGMAVADAKAKAEALTSAAGVKLLGIRHINYAIDENAFAVHPVVLHAGAARKMCADNAAPEIVPEEITAEDTVTVVWAIE